MGICNVFKTPELNINVRAPTYDEVKYCYDKLSNDKEVGKFLDIMCAAYKEDKAKSPERGDMEILEEHEKANQKLYDSVVKTAKQQLYYIDTIRDIVTGVVDEAVYQEDFRNAINELPYSVRNKITNTAREKGREVGYYKIT